MLVRLGCTLALSFNVMTFAQLTEDRESQDCSQAFCLPLEEALLR